VTTLVIGIGNRWRGDDGAGPAAVERFSEEGRTGGASVMAVHQLTPELAETLAGVSHVIFVDAAVDLQAGAVASRDLAPDESSRPTTHHLEPAAVLALSTTLYGRAPRATLVTIGAAQFDDVDRLSEPVQRAITEVVDVLRRLTGVA
jgi:hydrogenase maturation protease